MIRLSRIQIQQELGDLQPEEWAFHLLQQDPYAPFLSPSRTIFLIRKAFEIGEKWAKPFQNQITLTSIANHLVKDGVQILLVDQHPENLEVRAEYDRKQKRITIYRHSFAQLHRFFHQLGYEIPEEEWILLHLTHELFHHLETKLPNRREFPTPSVTFRKVGPLRFRRRIWSVREIAAHTFAQKTLHLPWSPYLLDLWFLSGDKDHTVNFDERVLQPLRMSYQQFLTQLDSGT
ncbi:hypothetical protein [Risungbinella massiliensis]|uniref:hypothetical protein n=1 Tax=Risungbinella massiliensis TaxID=1329796 RepID=UPI0005CB9406|nr:hypothetical protein [Risungbinella massiliensis]